MTPPITVSNMTVSDHDVWFALSKIRRRYANQVPGGVMTPPYEKILSIYFVRR